MKLRELILVVSCLGATSVAAVAEEKMSVKQIEEMGFAAIDTGNRGSLNTGAITAYMNLVFASMDSNDDKKVTIEEYMDWDLGASLIAEEAGKKDLYTAAKKIIFFYRDGDGDGSLTETEYRNSILRDFRRADRNGDGLLSKEEFSQQFTEIAALRAALK